MGDSNTAVCWGVLVGLGLPTVYLSTDKAKYTIGRRKGCDIAIPCKNLDVDVDPVFQISGEHVIISWNQHGIPGYGLERGPAESNSRQDIREPAFDMDPVGRNGATLHEDWDRSYSLQTLHYGDSIALVQPKVLRKKGYDPRYLHYYFLRPDTNINEFQDALRPPGSVSAHELEELTRQLSGVTLVAHPEEGGELHDA